jgi:hypothetical protein
MMTRFLLRPSALLATTLALGLGLSGAVLAEETRRIGGLSFDRIDVLGDLSVEIRQDEDYEIKIRGKQEHLDEEPYYVSKGRLVLGKSRGGSMNSQDHLKFRVTLPALHELRVRGSADVFVKPLVMEGEGDAGEIVVRADGSADIKFYSLRARSIDLHVKGSGDIKVAELRADDIEAVVAGSGSLHCGSVHAEYAEFTVTGSGDIFVAKESAVTSLELNIIGSGDVDMRSLDSDRAEVNIVGSGEAEIGTVATQLNSAVLGSGDVLYGGNPKVDSVELGSGEVRQRD